MGKCGDSSTGVQQEGTVLKSCLACSQKIQTQNKSNIVKNVMRALKMVCIKIIIFFLRGGRGQKKRMWESNAGKFHLYHIFKIYMHLCNYEIVYIYKQSLLPIFCLK